MDRKVFRLLLCLVFILPGVCFGADDETQRPLTPGEAAEFEGELANFGAEIYGVVVDSVEGGFDRTNPKKFVKNFQVKKKSSSPSRAARRAKAELKGQVKAHLKSLAQNGWIPLDNPKPGYAYSYKYGCSGLKFYCRIKASVTVWCAKVAQ